MIFDLALAHGGWAAWVDGLRRFENGCIDIAVVVSDDRGSESLTSCQGRASWMAK
jgi:hypothetical protein